LTLLSKMNELHQKLEGLRLVFDPRELIHLDHLIEDQLNEMTFGLCAWVLMMRLHPCYGDLLANFLSFHRKLKKNKKNKH